MFVYPILSLHSENSTIKAWVSDCVVRGNETTIFAIRGTQSPLDVMQDLSLDDTAVQRFGHLGNPQEKPWENGG